MRLDILQHNVSRLRWRQRRVGVLRESLPPHALMQGFASLCYGAAAVGGRVYSGQVSAQMCALATDLVI